MPNIKSQKDRVVQAKKEALHNKAIKSNLKTVVKKADAAISAGAADKDAAVKAAVVAIDKAAAKGVLHKNTASRKVSRLAKAADNAGKYATLSNPPAVRLNSGFFCCALAGFCARRSGVSSGPGFCPAARPESLPSARLSHRPRRL